MKIAHLVVFVSGLAASAQPQSGVLLGIHSSGGGSGAPSYKTYWITADAGGPRLSATLPDLVLPCKDGFWRVGVFANSFSKRYEPGSFMDMPGDEARYFEDQEDKLYIVPVAQAPRLDITADDPQPVSAKKEKATGGNPPPPAEEDDNAGQPCSVEEVAIRFLDPQNIGLTHRSSQTEYCAPARYATFGSNKLVSLDEALAAPAGDRPKGIVIMDQLTAAQKRILRKEVSTNLDTDIKGFDVLADVTLTLAHDHGNWILLAWREGSVASRGGEDFQLKILAPASLVHSPHGPPTLVAKMQMTMDIKDFFISPVGDLVVAIVGQKLVAYRVIAGKLSGAVELAQLFADDSGQAVPVMAEWASGKWVAVWDRQLKNLKLPAVETHAVKALR